MFQVNIISIYMASVQNCIEVEHIGRLLLPQLARKSRVQISKDYLKRCLVQINGNVQMNRRLEERSQGMLSSPLQLEQRVYINKQKDRNRKVDWGRSRSAWMPGFGFYSRGKGSMEGSWAEEKCEDSALRRSILHMHAG